ncbi:MAG: hypothetical protein ACI4IM_06735 [Acutalibacteraceae bacterium]
MAKGLPNSHKHIRNKQKSLRFSGDGKFRILKLTDIHEVDPEMDDDPDQQIPPKTHREQFESRRKRAI